MQKCVCCFKETGTIELDSKYMICKECYESCPLSDEDKIILVTFFDLDIVNWKGNKLCKVATICS